MTFKELTLQELKKHAKDLGLKNITKFKKEELIDVLENLNKKNKSENQKKVKEEGYKITNEEDQIAEGILEVLPDGYGFLRGDNYLPTSKDVYVSPVQIKRFNLDTGDMMKGITRKPKEGEKFPALIYVRRS